MGYLIRPFQLTVSKWSSWILPLLFAAQLFAAHAWDLTVAAEPAQDLSAELPRIPPLEPADALRSFTVASGFEIELVAAEPDVASPVALDFDPDGRLFVIEMRDYSEQDKEALGRIRLLDDRDGDGHYETSNTFAEGLSWPTAVACANGGVFVGAAPHLYFLKDTDGDDRADVKEIVFTGFGRDNVQGLLNSFQWGLDNRLHGATSSAGGQVRRPTDPPEKAISLRGRDFSIDTRTLSLRPESGGAQHGLSFDAWGRKFVSSNSDHIQLILFEDRYIARNPFLAAPSPRVSIAADGPQAEVFRTSPVEPWRIVRTRLRVAGAVPGPIEGGGRAAGYFTGATGVTIYRGDAWPGEYSGNAFIGDVGSNIVHRKLLEPNGVSLVARRAEERAAPGSAGGSKREFLASSDIWFRPAQFANGPDGNLYVIDVYREVIEHPASLPPVIKKHLDLTSGRDRGRIYRIKPAGFRRPEPVRLSDAPVSQLVGLLEHSNGWHRQTASRLLCERQDRAAVPLLEALARDSKSPLGRMHAIRALDGLDALSPDIIVTALDDSHPGVRRHAVQLAERLLDSRHVVKALQKRATDDNLLVRYQLAFTAGQLQRNPLIPLLIKLARSDAADPWMRLAMLSSLADGAGELFVELAADDQFRKTPGGADLLKQLARQIGAQQNKLDGRLVVEVLEALIDTDRPFAESILISYLAGARHAATTGDSATTAASERLRKLAAQLTERAQTEALDLRLAASARNRAIELLALGSFSAAKETFTQLLGTGQPPEVQLAAVAALRRFDDRAVAEVLLEAWPQLTPRVRTEALEVLFSRDAFLPPLLQAIEEQSIPAAEIDATRIKRLTDHSSKRIRQQARRLFSSSSRDRAAIVKQYEPALSLAGSAERGRTVFRQICAACHRAENEGHEIGPNLATLQNRGPEAILLNVFDPNREVNPQYVSYSVATTDGRTATGLIAAETATTLVLKRGEGVTETLLRSDIEELKSTGLSIMPEGLEKQVDLQSMADLLAYLQTLK